MGACQTAALPRGHCLLQRVKPLQHAGILNSMPVIGTATINKCLLNE